MRGWMGAALLAALAMGCDSDDGGDGGGGGGGGGPITNCTTQTARVTNAGVLEVDIDRDITCRTEVELTARSQLALYASAPLGCQNKTVTLTAADGRAVDFPPLEGLCGFYRTPASIDAGTYTLEISTGDIDPTEAFFEIGSIQRTAGDGEACARIDETFVHALDAPLGCQDAFDCVPTDVPDAGVCSPRTVLTVEEGWRANPVDVRPLDEINGAVTVDRFVIRLMLDEPTALSWLHHDCPTARVVLSQLDEAPEGEVGPVPDELEVARASFISCAPHDLGELPAGETYFVVEATDMAAVNFLFAPTRSAQERCDRQRKFGSCAEDLRCRTAVDDSADGVCEP